MSDFREDLKDVQHSMYQRISAIAVSFFECAVMKKSELQRRRAEFIALINQGNYNEVLSIISALLAQNNDIGIFTGLISDYMAGGDLISSKELTKRIDNSIEVCQQRMNSFNMDKLESWVKDMEKDLGKSL